jgi:hypothetical protein
MEQWLPYPPDPRYLVSDEGRVRGARGKILKLTRKDSGHLQFQAGRSVGVHRAVALVFLGTRPEGMEVCHNDGNPENNRVANLRYDTSTANKADMVEHGTRLQGEYVGTHKLTEADVREIRRLQGQVDGPTLGLRYGVSKTQIYTIWSRKAWKHIE